MQDRLLPRFWSVKEKQYIYPDCYMQTAFNRSLKENEFGLLYRLFSNTISFIPELPTGLKDKNGNLIYEGDIVEIECRNDDIKKAVVEWIDTSGCWYISIKDCYGDGYMFYELSNNELKIIGNVHTNPELLEKNDD